MIVKSKAIAGIVLLTLVCGVCLAQTAARPLQGTVTFRDGRTITGEVKLAQLGVAPGSGIGTLLPDGGYFAVKVGAETVKAPAAEIASVEAQWEQGGTPERPTWVIKQLKITTRAGKEITGPPAWPPIHASSVEVGDKQVYSFPLAGVDFSPDNFLARIDISTTAPAAATTPPAATTPATTTPATTPAPTVISVPPPTTSGTPTPATTTPPAVTTPPATTPPATTPTPISVPAPTTGPTPPAATVPPPTVTPASTPPVATPPVTVPAVVGRSLTSGAIELIVKCPDCGKDIRIVVQIAAGVAQQP
jgi:hypothetical protein